jgi:hypothetical protein
VGRLAVDGPDPMSNIHRAPPRTALKLVVVLMTFVLAALASSLVGR